MPTEMGDALTRTADDAWQAAQVVGRLWEALATDDDALALQVTTSGIHGDLGTHEGFADRLRQGIGVEQSTAGRVGVSSKVRVLQGVMIFPCFDVGEGRSSRLVGSWGPEVLSGWLLWVAVEGGRWRVAGQYQQPDGGWPPDTEYLDLPTAPPLDGSVQ